LADAQLYERLDRLGKALSKAPEQSIPQACGSVRETKAAYRFFGVTQFTNLDITPDGKYLVMIVDLCRVVLWDFEAGKEIQQFC
jgi:hypothetical protein